MSASPVLRLLARALLAGVATFTTTLNQTSGHIGRDVLIGALTATGWTVAEYLTPLNAFVGVGKKSVP